MTGLLRALGAGVLLLALAACTQPDDDPEPIMPSESTSAPTAPSSTPAPEPESPKAFVRRWVEAGNAMKDTGDASEYRSLSTGCSGCRDFADQVERFYRRGGWVRTEGWRITHVFPVPPPRQRQTEVKISIISAPTTYKKSRTSEPIHLTGGEFNYFISLMRRGTSWVVIGYAQESH